MAYTLQTNQDGSMTYRTNPTFGQNYQHKYTQAGAAALATGDPYGSPYSTPPPDLTKAVDGKIGSFALAPPPVIEAPPTPKVESVGYTALTGLAGKGKELEQAPTEIKRSPAEIQIGNYAAKVLSGAITAEQVPDAIRGAVNKAVGKAREQQPTQPARSAEQIAFDNKAALDRQAAKAAGHLKDQTPVIPPGGTPPIGPFGYAQGLQGYTDFVQRSFGMSLEDFGKQYGITFDPQTGKPVLNVPVAAENFYETQLGQATADYAKNYMAGLPDLINLYKTQGEEALAANWRDSWKQINENISQLGIGSDGGALLMLTMGNRQFSDQISKLDLDLLVKQKEFSKEGASFALDLMKYGEDVRAAKTGEAQDWATTMANQVRDKMTYSRETYEAITRLGFDAAAQNLIQNNLDLQYRMGTFKDIAEMVADGTITADAGTAIYNAAMTGIQTGDWSGFETTAESFGVETEGLGLYHTQEDVGAAVKVWTDSGFLANMTEVKDADGNVIGWEVKPIMQEITQPDGTVILGLFRPENNIQLNTLVSNAQKAGKKITSTILPDGKVSYKISDEALAPGETMKVAADGTISYGAPTVEEAKPLKDAMIGDSVVFNGAMQTVKYKTTFGGGEWSMIADPSGKNTFIGADGTAYTPTDIANKFMTGKGDPVELNYLDMLHENGYSFTWEEVPGYGSVWHFLGPDGAEITWGGGGSTIPATNEKRKLTSTEKPMKREL